MDCTIEVVAVPVSDAYTRQAGFAWTIQEIGYRAGPADADSGDEDR